MKGDINDPDAVRKALQDIEIVFHSAAMVSVPRCSKEPELAKRINVEGTRNLLRIAADSKVERFVFASSAAVYQAAKPVVVTSR